MYVREKMQRLNNIHVYLGQVLHCSQVRDYACFSVVYFFFKTTLNFQGYHQSVKQFGSRSSPTSCQRPTLVSRQIYAITAKIS